MEVRALRRDDDAAVSRLWVEGFGEHPERAIDHADHVNPLDRPGGRFQAAFEGEELLGTIVDREYDSWFGGASVPTAGIASVAVSAEARGRGVLTPLVGACLDGARDRGAVVSSLFPTAPGIYRRFGYEIVTALDDVEAPTEAFDVPGDPVPLRRAGADDREAIHGVYDRWASGVNGPLTRRGPSFPDADLATTTLTEVDGHVTGYVSWSRGEGYGPGAQLRVWDLLADDRDSLAALMRSIASHGSVTPTVLVRTSGLDPWRHLLRGMVERVTRRQPYMVAVLDVSAFDHLHYPDVDLELPFRWRDTGHVLTVSGGRGHVAVDATARGRELTDRGLALAFTGAQPSAVQRRLGLLAGDDRDDAWWDALLTRPVHIRDYF